MSGFDLPTEWLAQLDRAASESRDNLGTLGESETFLEWCQRLADGGLKVDGKPFTLDDRPSLVPIYDAIPSTHPEALRKTLVVMKSAQMGLTVLEMLADIFFALRFEPCAIGLFLPDQALASDKSRQRMINIMRSIPDVHHKLTHRLVPGGTVNVGEGNVMTRVLGGSIFYFLWASSQVGTESRPMDIVTLDEVQQITLEQIDRIQERMSASSIRWRFLLSTANIPDNDIDFWFKQGTQEEWHTECPRCRAETDLSKHWPDCCVYNEGQIVSAEINEWVYTCSECGNWLEDTQRGRFIAANPDASIRSFHISQIISPTITARDMAEAWNRAVTGDQRKTFYNRKLGRPYIDREQLPVTMADCLACVAEGLKIGLAWQVSAKDTYMGVDQMGGYNAVIIKRRLPDGRQAVVHAEAIFDIDPFERCAELMEDYGVSLCVVEQLPNVNDARRFANLFRGRVYLAGYATDPKSDMVTWGDAISRSDRKTSEEDRTRYTVVLQQYKAMQASLFRIRNRHCLFPDPALLEADVIERGEKKRINLCRDWVFVHFTKTALVVEQDEETRSPKPKVVKIGIDPHFSFANMLCDAAWVRVHGNSMFILPEAGPKGSRPEPEHDLARKVEKAMPGLPRSVLAMLDSGERPGTCSSCSEFVKGEPGKAGRCSVRQLFVEPTMVSCILYNPKRS